ncbi:hypothetical protein ACEQ8H_007436 [Pleosporales sp. CAS-2024a]
MATTCPRHVLITGGSRGIGLAIAQLFARNSYRCTLIARNEENLLAAVNTLTPLSSSHLNDRTKCHAYIAGNLAKGSEFWDTHFPRHVIQTLPEQAAIHVLVNCAGMTQSSLFIRTGFSQTEDIVNLNLTALMVGTRTLLYRKYFCRTAGDMASFSPSIINVSSLLGLSGGYGAVTYAASKAGVLGFTRALATEYASHKVRVNAIVPGYVMTDMTKDLDEEHLKRRIPLGRFGRPEEIAKAALFLAETEYAHNCVLNLDGGLSAV